MQTNTESVKAAFERLSGAVLGAGGPDCTVNKDDLATLLLAYRLELGNSVGGDSRENQ